MFAHCSGPLWRGDDLSLCIQKDYLLTLFPLTAGAISLLVLALSCLQQWLVSRKHKPESRNLVDVADDGDVSADEEDSLSNLTLQKTLSRTNLSVLEVDKPVGEITLVVVELVALLGQLAVSLVGWVLAARSRHGKALQIPISGLVTWGYIVVLVAARLFSSTRQKSLSFLKMWNHTAFLYAVQWILQVGIFRSVLIHGQQIVPEILVIVEFALTTLLVIIALVSRKGNKQIVLEYEGDIEPSPEPRASLFSLASFSWVDAIIWRGYKKPLELTDVWNINLKDKAARVLAHFRQTKKTHSFALRLLLYFRNQLLIQASWTVVGSVFMFLPTLILKAILEYLENPSSTPANAAWLYVILLFATNVVQAVADGQGLWIGRKISIRIRAIIIGEIYSKTLRRKAAAAAVENANGKEEKPEPKPLSKKILSFGRKKRKDAENENVSSSDKSTEAMANNGTIINLMSIDSFKVSDTCAYLHFLWVGAPIQLGMAIGLLYRILGFSSFAGIGLMVMILPLNMFIAKSFHAVQKKIMAATDSRIHTTNEVLQNIRIIKYFAWEKRFSENVSEKRLIEIAALRRKYILWACAATLWAAVPIFITFTSFLIYTMVEKKALVPSIAFPALSMFALLRIPLDQLAGMVAHVQESKVSVDRVEEFMNEEETEKYTQLRDSRQNQIDEPRIALQDATLTWGAKVDPASKRPAADSFRLIDINVEFVIGRLNIIAGPTGSGKTSLLMALLGEMKLLQGRVQIPGGSCRQVLRPDPQTGLTESVAYCAQQAWLVNNTIKENIIFASPYDEQRYKDVISACALNRDLDMLDSGDQTLVGEKGIALSGGQKQRISLARAIYCNSKHLLLDDCLSAVDSHTAKHIFEEAIMGQLMAGRTCILVTHNVTLTVPRSSFVVLLQNGKITAQGEPENLIVSGVLGDDLLKSRPASRVASKAPSRVSSNLEEERSRLAGENGLPNGQANVSAKKDAKEDKGFVDTRIETKATGNVKMTTIRMYLRAMGPWYFWVFVASAFIASQMGSVATNVWIRQWANSYHTSRVDSRYAIINGVQRPAGVASDPLLSGSRFTTLQGISSITAFSTTSILHDVDAGYYLVIYALIGMAYVTICLLHELVLFWGSLHASWQIHQKLLTGVLRAKFKFFDSTPLGQLMNRFSKDVQQIDQEVAPVAIGMIHSLASVVTIVILISVITPGFLIAGVFISAMYAATGLFYIRSSRDLKRIEAVQRSPLFQHFGETISGVVTIRAYGDESRFVQESHSQVNTHNRPYIFLWATNRWLAFRVDIAGAFVAFFSGVFVISNVGRIDAGAAGLALSYAITFTENVLWLVRLYAANEQNMNAVERVQEYIDVEQEARAEIPETKPSVNWPSHGCVEFIGYSTRYRADLDPVLKKLTFKIRAGEKVGIVGRTGAGKSSLALALFRGLEADEGKIVIDEVDIGLIGLQDLRESITIVPQDPTLFTGTVRSNLDPFSLFTDDDIFAALRRVQLISGVGESSTPSTPSNTSQASIKSSLTPASTLKQVDSTPESSNGSTSSDATLIQDMSNSHDNKNVFHDLSSSISESGSNLSQGQRQLLCLARALLKAPKVLVMDEATASIDYATDARIQDTLRELKNNTLITIAHRLQTIIDYDKVLVLDKGEIIEYADPWDLMRKEAGYFRSMCESSGDFDTLSELAKKAWLDRRLVDDE